MQPEKRRQSPPPVRKGKKKPRKRALHIGMSYTGWRHVGSGRYETVDKIAYASFSEAKPFLSKIQALQQQRYDMDGVQLRIVNGDGAKWISGAAEAGDAILQLDTYHRNRAVIKSVGDRAERNALFEVIKEKDVGNILSSVEALIAGARDAREREKLEDLHLYFYENRESLLTWQERGVELPEPPPGIEYRNLGAQESCNGSIVTQRMKHRKASWTPAGANNMLLALCLRHTVGYDLLLGTLPDTPSGIAHAEPLSAARTPQYDGEGYTGRTAPMPFDQTFRTNGREAIKGLLRRRPLADLSFR